VIGPRYDANGVLDLASYREFLEAKRPRARVYGAPIDTAALNPMLKDFQAAIAGWAIQGGRRAIFARFGLGKTFMQLEIMRHVVERAGGMGLIVCPLGVRQEFMLDAAKLGIIIRFIRTTAEIDGPGLYLTNYESVREGKIDVSVFVAVSLDEAAILRGFGGTKTFREFMRRFEHTQYRFVATATPSPNDYIELLAYAAFLGVMDVGEAKTRFFKRNPEKADELTIHPHKVEEFWLWVNSWAVFLQRPSDLGFSDEGYVLPPMDVEWVCVDAGSIDAGAERDGQGKLLRTESMGASQASAEKRATMPARLAKVRELVNARPDEHVIIWHDLEDERRALESSIEDLVSVYGSQDLDEREAAVADFANGRIPRLAGKPVMLGSGCNLQRHCAWAVFAGVGFKFNDFIQAVHRIYRFLQTRTVRISIIYGSGEQEVVRVLQEKWKRYDELMERMSVLIREYGLNPIAAQEQLVRSIGVARRVERGERFEVVNADTVEETAAMQASSVGLIVTSIPFGTQYEYTPSYNDFGHTDNDGHFWQQMDFLSPELLRVLKPGRVMGVHVKDRIRPGGMDGLGFQTASPFHADAILHYRRHGFAYLGMITIATDVVRENNQTHRLGYTEQCKDGSRIGVGMPEYVLLFRKPPTDSSDGYADERVIKAKSDYSIARWQIDAHALWRSNGNRLLAPEDLVGLPADEVFKRFRGWSFARYDYGAHVAVGEALAKAKRLPSGFMLLQPASNIDDVWTDVARMRTLNGAQAAAGKEMHLCPLQFDIIDRLIDRYSNPDDEVYDPFGGLLTTVLQAIKKGRRGRAHELNGKYFDDGVRYLRAAEESATAPTLFDLVADEESAV
jgi:DNA modification methylase